MSVWVSGADSVDVAVKAPSAVVKKYTITATRVASPSTRKILAAETVSQSYPADQEVAVLPGLHAGLSYVITGSATLLSGGDAPMDGKLYVTMPAAASKELLPSLVSPPIAREYHGAACISLSSDGAYLLRLVCFILRIGAGGSITLRLTIPASGTTSKKPNYSSYVQFL